MTSNNSFYRLREKYAAIFVEEKTYCSSLPPEWFLLFSAERVWNDEFPSTRVGSTEPIPKLFHFVRCARAHPQLGELDAESALSVVYRSMKELNWDWSIVSDVEDDEENEIAFLDHWEGVKYPEGSSPLDCAVRLAKKQPVTLLVSSKRQLYVTFIGTAYYLHRNLPEHTHNILLPCHITGDALGCSHETVYRMIKSAVSDGYLAVASSGIYRGESGFGRAAEYRFASGLFDTEGRQIKLSSQVTYPPEKPEPDF